MLPAYGGILAEVWQLVHDGGAGSIAITSDTMRYVLYAAQSGGSNNIVANNTSKTVTFTWTANNSPANATTSQVILYGKT
jgi:hypothetical protein